MSAASSYCRVAQGLRNSLEDRAGIFGSTFAGRPATVLAVADGMGGLQAGDRAAEAAVATVARFARDLLPNLAHDFDLRSALYETFEVANAAVREIADELGETASVGTTLVVVVSTARGFVTANVGDSRAYYVSRSATYPITRDHNLAAEGERANAALSHVLTRSLGEVAVVVDVFPTTGWSVVDEPCVLLACTDGVHGIVGESEMQAQCVGTERLKVAVDNLLSMALMSGSQDNLGIAAIECGDLQRAEPRLPVLPDVEKVMAQQQKASRAKSRRASPTSLAALVVVFLLTLAGFVAVLVLMPDDSGGAMIGDSAPVRAGTSAATEPPAQGAPAAESTPKSETTENDRSSRVPVSRQQRPEAPKVLQTRPTSQPPVAPVLPGPQPVASEKEQPPPPTPPTSKPEPSRGAETAASPLSEPALQVELSVPSELEADGPGGRTIAYTSAAWAGSRQVPVRCQPASGSTLAIGKHTIECVATDPTSGRRIEKGATVEVRDSTSPVIRAVNFVVVRTDRRLFRAGVVRVAVEVDVDDLNDRSPACVVSNVRRVDGSRWSTEDAKIDGLLFSFLESAPASVDVLCRDASGNETRITRTFRVTR